MSQFESETALERIDAGRFRGFVDGAWRIGDNPNGGYLLSLVSSAIGQSVSHPDPLTITTHYLRPGIANEACEIDVDVVRVGRSLSTIRATLRQAGKARLEVLAGYGDLGAAAGIESKLTIDRPMVPPPEQCIARTGEMQGIELAISERLDVMLHPQQARPGESTEPVLSGWIKFKDGTAPDTRSLLLFCDTFPPSVFGVLGTIGWVPTIELTVHVRRRPAAGWILGQFRTDDLEGGRMIESGCLWDSRGELVAQSRQIGLVLQQH